MTALRTDVDGNRVFTEGVDTVIVSDHIINLRQKVEGKLVAEKQYLLDIIDEFLHFTGGKYREIVALEPDNKTYGKLIQHTARMQNTRCFCMGIWSENTDLCFDGSLGRGSSVRKDGKSAVPVTTIDTLFRKRPLTYLKIDAEGAEAEALAGGETVIRRDKPRMNMALYHRSEDIFRLPLMLKSIRPDYRLYIRQHPHIPAWDLNLYAI